MTFLKMCLFLILAISHGQTAPYTGRLSCEALPELLGWLPGDPALQCQMAMKSCETQKNLKKLKPEDPLYPIIKERLEDYINLAFEICELAIAAYDQDYYNRHLKR